MQHHRARLFLVVLFFLSLALNACANPHSSSPLPPTATRTQTYSVTPESPEPTSSSTPSPIAHPADLPAPVEIARLGGGFIYDLSWSRDGDRLAVLGSDQVAWYDPNRLTEVASAPLAFDFRDARFTGGDTSLVFQDWKESGIDFGVFDLVRKSLSAKLFIQANSNIQGSSSDGRLLAVPIQWDENDNPHALEIWDLASGEKRFDLVPDTSEPLGRFTFDQTSGLIAAASSDGHLWLWDPGSDQLIHDLATPVTGFFDVQVMPEGEGIAASTENGDLWLWRTSEAHARGPYPLGVSYPFLSISPDGRFVAASTYGGPLKLLELSPELEQVQIATLARESSGRPMVFSPDSGQLASVDSNGAVRLWSTATGRPSGVIPLYTNYFQGLAWSPDGRAIAAGGGSAADAQGFVTLWDLERRSVDWLAEPSRGVLSNLVFIPGTDRVVTFPEATGGMLSVLDTEQGALVHGISLPPGDAGGFALSPDGKTLAVAAGSQVLLFDTRSWKRSLSWQAGGPSPALAFSPDGNNLRTVTLSNTGVLINAWDARSGELLSSLPLSREGWDYHLSADSNTLAGASSSTDSSLAFMDSVRSGEELYTVRETRPGESFEALALSPDSQLLALGDGSGFTLLDAATGKTLARIEREGNLGSMAFSPDSRKLAMVTDIIEIWDLSALLDSYVSVPQAAITPDPILTQAAATAAFYTPTADLRAYIDNWQTYTDDPLGIRFEYPALYDQIWNSSCAPHSYVNVNGKPYTTLGARTYLWREPAGGRSLLEYVNSQTQQVTEEKYSSSLFLTPMSFGPNEVLSGYELQYRFGSLGRLGLLYFLRHQDFFYVVDFTAGLTCDFREINLNELDVLRRLLDTIEFTE